MSLQVWQIGNFSGSRPFASSWSFILRISCAVSGEITLHGDEIYVQVSIPCIRPGREVMFRRCKGRQDYLGDRNHFCDIAVLAAPQSFRALVVRETGLSINPRQQALV